MQAFWFVAIRRSIDSGRDWMDSSTISPWRELVDVKVKEKEATITSWAKANPVVRISRVLVTEVTE